MRIAIVRVNQGSLRIVPQKEQRPTTIVCIAELRIYLRMHCSILRPVHACCEI